MKMAVETMEMAPGAIPYPDRVLEQGFLSPRNWSSMAVVLQNFLWMDADSFRVFASEGIYRRKGDVRGHPGDPHHLVARPGGTHATWCGCLLALLCLPFGLHLRDSKIGNLGFVSSIPRIFPV
jgi:hypothetical protein